jgi:hypothetical protein
MVETCSDCISASVSKSASEEIFFRDECPSWTNNATCYASEGTSSKGNTTPLPGRIATILASCPSLGNLVLLSMRPGPFGPGLFPRESPALFALEPLVFADLFLNQVGDPVEGVRIHHRRDRHMLLDFQNLAHRFLSLSSEAGRKKRFCNGKCNPKKILETWVARLATGTAGRPSRTAKLLKNC